MSGEHAFSDELYGEVIDGIDLAILSLDSARLIDAYVKQGCELSKIQSRVLLQCHRELQMIIPKVDGLARKHFEELLHGVQAIINRIKE